jgi:hypothetical protein
MVPYLKDSITCFEKERKKYSVCMFCVVRKLCSYLIISVSRRGTPLVSKALVCRSDCSEPIAVVDWCSGRRIVDGARRFRGKCKGHKIEPHSRSVDCGIYTGNELRQAEEAHR